MNVRKLFGKHKHNKSRQNDESDIVRQYVIRKSICTGERVAGYLDENGRFNDIVLINGDADLNAFCKKYKVDKSKIREIY